MAGAIYPDLPSNRERSYESDDFDSSDEGVYSANELGGLIYQDEPLSLDDLKHERWGYVCDMVDSHLKVRNLMVIAFIRDEFFHRNREDGIVNSGHDSLSASITRLIDRNLVYIRKLTGLIERVDAEIKNRFGAQLNNNGEVNDNS